MDFSIAVSLNLQSVAYKLAPPILDITSCDLLRLKSVL